MNLRQLNSSTRRKFKAAAAELPDEVVESIHLRAIEAVASGEPHKPTGGWVVLPFQGKGHSILGLLETASKAIKAAQLESLK